MIKMKTVAINDTQLIPVGSEGALFVDAGYEPGKRNGRLGNAPVMLRNMQANDSWSKKVYDKNKSYPKVLMPDQPKGYLKMRDFDFL